MIRIGITGQAGFIGRHLYNALGTLPDVERVPFEKTFSIRRNGCGLSCGRAMRSCISPP